MLSGRIVINLIVDGIRFVIDPMVAPVLPAVAEALAAARRVLVITGAGMSADSGVPTYRGIGGLYNGVETDDGVPIEVALSGPMLRSRPAVCWKYLAEIERGARGRLAHAGHQILASLAPRFERFTVLTQNVDGFHAQAGQSDVIEMHGNLFDLSCMRCDYRTRVSDYSGLDIPPRCPSCDGVVRPAVVLFGESLPADGIRRLEAALQDDLDFVLTIGTTSVFPYIAGPVLQAARAGIAAAEINPGESEVSSIVRYRITERAAPALEQLHRLMQNA